MSYMYEILAKTVETETVKRKRKFTIISEEPLTEGMVIAKIYKNEYDETDIIEEDIGGYVDVDVEEIDYIIQMDKYTTKKLK